METKDVTEDGPLQPLTSLRTTVSQIKDHMPIPDVMVLVVLKVVTSESLVTRTYPWVTVMPLPPPLPEVPYQYVLMPLTGHSMPVVSSETVPPTSTTPYSLPDKTDLETGRSRTHGVPDGVQVDISPLLPETPVVSVCMLPPPIESSSSR